MQQFIPPEHQNVQENQEPRVKNQPKREPPHQGIPEKPSRFAQFSSGIVKSPWIMVGVATLLCGIWIIQNWQFVLDNMNTPYAMLSGPAFVGSILVGIFVIKFFQAIISAIKIAWNSFSAWRKKDGSTYWMVIIIFMFVSVFESGEYFNNLLGKSVLSAPIGYVVALFIDLVAIENMKARQRAKRMRDKFGQILYMIGVIVCAGISAYANTYTALENYVAPTKTLAPEWMMQVAPWTGMVFPLLIIFLTIAGDYTIDQASTRLDPEAYEASENKRIEMLKIQKAKLEERLNLERAIDELSGNRERRVFFLANWLLPKEYKTRVEMHIENLEGQLEEAKKSLEKTMEDAQRLMEKQREAVNEALDEHTNKVLRATQQQRLPGDTDPLGTVTRVPEPPKRGRPSKEELRRRALMNNEGGYGDESYVVSQ